MKRKKWMQIAILMSILLIAGITTANGWSKSQDKPPEVGEKAPDFKLADLNGTVHKLSSYRGKAVVVTFWGTWCPPCRAEMPAFENQSQEWDGSVQILGVNLKGDNDLSVRNFVRKYNLTFPIVPDSTDEIRKRYRVTYYPTTFFIDQDGIIRKVKTGEMDETFIRSTLAGIVQQ